MPNYLSIPLPNQTLASSQPQIKDNFDIANTTIAANHVPMTDPTVANRGKHNIVVLPQQPAAGPATTASEGALYTTSIGGSPNLVWRQKSSGSNVQLTANVTPVTGTPGYTFLPGGLLMQWGSFSLHGNNVFDTINYPIAFASAAYSIQITITHGASSSAVAYLNNAGGSSTAAHFQASQDGGSAHSIFWLAIGRAV